MPALLFRISSSEKRIRQSRYGVRLYLLASSFGTDLLNLMSRYRLRATVNPPALPVWDAMAMALAFRCTLTNIHEA
ncbi:hypothetical protein CEXT_396991 [Caerostris extrusa]|uniref:Uncharacterized protein n=1 Tax=Caerostris extrusa TaxID=172846 RepID=A0AAV4N2M6_CAEEX|nr:hypothetical protein CEXT_396991 [Caerostris extrusa]